MTLRARAAVRCIASLQSSGQQRLDLALAHHPNEKRRLTVDSRYR
jgi:hypothetical protein